MAVAVGRAERRAIRRPLVATRFAKDDTERVLDLLELVELAWHDCYDEVSPPEKAIDDILLVSQSEWPRLIAAARLAVVDHRDLKLQADALRQRDESS